MSVGAISALAIALVVAYSVGLFDPLLPPHESSTARRFRAVCAKRVGSFSVIGDAFGAAKAAFAVPFESGSRVGIGLFFDKPGNTSRWAVGFECRDDVECGTAFRTLQQLNGSQNALLLDVPAGQRQWVVDMPIRSFLSPMINAYRVWGWLERWLDENKVHTSSPVVELYDNVTERFVVFETAIAMW